MSFESSQIVKNITNQNQLNEVWNEYLIDHGRYLFFKPIIPYINKYINKPERSKLLDIGCGTGEKANVFEKMGFKVSGVDYSEDFIKKASSNYPSIHFKTADIQKSIPFETNSFDFIFSNSVFQYIEHEAVIDECRRVLKPGGRLILVENLKHNPITRLGRAYLKLTGYDFQSYPYNHFTLNEAKGLAETFDNSEIKVFHLSSMLCAFKIFKPFFNTFSNIDEKLLTVKPLQHIAWLVFFTAQNRKEC